MFDLLGGKYLTPRFRKAFEEWPVFTSIVQVSFGINTPVVTRYHTLQVINPGIRIGSTILPNGYTISDYNHDPVITPEGKCVMKLLFESPWEFWESLDDAAYEKEKTRIAEDAGRILAALYPATEGHLEVVDVATPRTDVRYTGVWKGSFEGFLPSGKNILETLPMEIPGLKGLYLTGQWLFPGGGLPPAAQSGKWAIQTICKRDKIRFKTRIS
jgi:phytoene dehydrogenase-like protein